MAIGSKYASMGENYHSVPQIRPPLFAILALVQNTGGAYTRDATISLVITPSLPVKHDLIVGGGWAPSARRRDAPDASRRLTSFSIEGEGGGCLCEVAGMSIVDAGGMCSTL